MKYRFLDEIRSDVMFEAYGKSLKELFQNAAEALSSVICKVGKVSPKEAVDVEVKADDLDHLMINWLQEIIAAVDTEQKFFSKFEVDDATDNHLKARIYGESIRPELGETVVKAVTLFKFKLEKTKKGYITRVSLDI